MTSKCGKNKKVAHEAQPSVSLMLSPHFDVFCDLLPDRRTATWNLFVLYNKETSHTNFRLSQPLTSRAHPFHILTNLKIAI